MNDGFIYMTQDPAPSSRADLVKPEYDIFDSVKVKNLPIVDIVWAPDCAGPWSDMLKLPDRDERITKLIELITIMSSCLRPGGYLMLSKGFESKSNSFDDAAVETVIERIKEKQEFSWARKDVIKDPSPHPENDDWTQTYLVVQKSKSALKNKNAGCKSFFGFEIKSKSALKNKNAG